MTLYVLNSPDELHQPLPVVDGAYLAAQDPVQDLADGEGEGAGQQHEQLGQPDGVGPHRQAVPRADSLRDDLPEHHDTHGGPDHGQRPAPASEHVQGDGQGVVDQDIAQQDGAQQEVAHAPDGHDGPGVGLLSLRPGVHDNLELGLVEAHEAEVEAGEEARQAEEDRQQQHTGPDRQQGSPGDKREMMMVCCLSDL